MGAHGHVGEGTLPQAAGEAGVAEIVGARGEGDDVLDALEHAAGELHLRLAGERGEDVGELGRAVVGELDEGLEARAQARVHVDELGHLRLIAGDDHRQRVAVILHGLHERGDGLAPVVVAALGDERIGLVDEQHAGAGCVDGGLRLGRGLADVLGDEAAAVDLVEARTLERTAGCVHARHDARDRRLARPRRAAEHEVQAARDFRQARALALGIGEHDRQHLAQLLLHGREPHQLVEIRQYGLGRLGCERGRFDLLHLALHGDRRTRTCCACIRSVLDSKPVRRRQHGAGHRLALGEQCLGLGVKTVRGHGVARRREQLDHLSRIQTRRGIQRADREHDVARLDVRVREGLGRREGGVLDQRARAHCTSPSQRPRTSCPRTAP